MSYSLIIAANTKLLRARLGIRQQDLAKAMGTSQGQVAALEMAKNSIGLHTLTRLASSLKVEPQQLLVPMSKDDQPAPKNGQAGEIVQSDVARPAHSASVASDLVTGGLAVGVSLSTLKGIVAAMHKRLEALERRHGSVPMTREMLTSLLVVLLTASQNIDNNEDEP